MKSKIKLREAVCCGARGGAHQWKEDPMFASGATTMVGGSPKSLGEEPRIICKKCKTIEYVRAGDLGGLVDAHKSVESEI